MVNATPTDHLQENRGDCRAGQASQRKEVDAIEVIALIVALLVVLVIVTRR